MLEQLQLSVGTFREDRCAEGLHDLLYRHGLSGELVLGGTVKKRERRAVRRFQEVSTDQTSPKAPIPTGCRSVYLGTLVKSQQKVNQRRVPAGDLEGGAKDLGTYELRHLE